MTVLRGGTSRGMNAALQADNAATRLPHTSRRQLIVAVIITVAAIAGAAAVYVFYIRSASTYPGTIEQSQASQLNFLAPGRISEVLVKPGQHVKAGDVLARQDPAIAQADLKSAQSVLAQDEAKLAFLKAPALSTAQATQARLNVQQAQSTLDGDQVAANNAQASLSTSSGSAQATVNAATTALSTDRAQFKKACPHGVGAPPAAGAPAGSLQIFMNCQTLNSQVSRDQTALSSAFAEQAATVQTAQQLLDKANASVANDRAALQAAQNEASSQSAQLTSPAAIADASSAVALATQAVDSANAALKALTLVAPSDGTIADVAGLPGEYADTTGVRNYNGPQSQTSNTTPTYSLFPPSSNQSGNQGNAATQNPVVTFYPTGGMQILAEVPESDVGKMTQGRHVHITVNVLSLKVTGTVSYVVPIAVHGSSGVTYQVVILCSQLTDRVLPGMSASVTV